MKTRQLKYDWQRSWPDRPDDYVCWADGDIVGRVQLHNAGHSKYWIWSMSIDRIEAIQAVSGYADDKIEACRQLEAAYDAANQTAI